MDLLPELTEFKNNIAARVTYGGQKISPSILQLIEIEIREETGGGGVLAPFWLGVLQRGRGPRRSNTDHQLWKKIYGWMEKRNLFRSKSPEGKVNEAKGVTWYINKYGNKQFRTKTFIDVYTTARAQCVESVMKKYSLEVARITNDIL